MGLARTTIYLLLLGFCLDTNAVTVIRGKWGPFIIPSWSLEQSSVITPDSGVTSIQGSGKYKATGSSKGLKVGIAYMATVPILLGYDWSVGDLKVATDAGEKEFEISQHGPSLAFKFRYFDVYGTYLAQARDTFKNIEINSVHGDAKLSGSGYTLGVTMPAWPVWLLRVIYLSYTHVKYDKFEHAGYATPPSTTVQAYDGFRVGLIFQLIL